MKKYRFTLQLRFSDYDSQKVVNHTKIYALIEVAYTNFFTEKINKEWTPDFMPLLLRKSMTDFLLPIKHGMQPLAVVSVKEVRGSSFTLSISILDRQSKNLHVESTRLFVFINPITQKPERLNELQIKTLNTFI